MTTRDRMLEDPPGRTLADLPRVTCEECGRDVFVYRDAGRLVITSHGTPCPYAQVAVSK